MKVLLIEDEKGFVAQLKGIASKYKSTDLVIQDDLGPRFKPEPRDDLALEEQLTEHLKEIVQENAIDLILLDTDLSRDIDLRSQTEYRYALSEIGIPTLRYRKRGHRGKAEILRFVHRLAVEGATAVKVPDELVRNRGPEEDLFPWLEQIHAGFKALNDALKERPEYLESGGGPAGILARILGKPYMHAELLGYTAPNAYFFGTTEDPKASTEQGRKAFATRLGYWLLNYILAFPGPILPRAAAAAALNLKVESFKRADVQQVVDPARYDGPFGGLPGGFYWRQALVDLLMDADGDIVNAIDSQAETLERVDSSNPFSQAFYCLVNDTPIAARDASVSPDWIPAGATMSRISQDELDELGPMLNI